MAWWHNGFTLVSDMRVLDLNSYDAILGYDWLKLHNPIPCHWDKNMIEFEEKGKVVRLRGVQNVGSQVQELSAGSLINWYKGNDIWTMVLLTEEKEVDHATTDDAVQALLEQYAGVLDDPKTLPPSRTYDHSIPLLPSAVPINSRPHRYSP